MGKKKSQKVNLSVCVGVSLSQAHRRSNNNNNNKTSKTNKQTNSTICGAFTKYQTLPNQKLSPFYGVETEA